MTDIPTAGGTPKKVESYGEEALRNSQIQLNGAMEEYYQSRKKFYDEFILLAKEIGPTAKKVPGLFTKLEQFLDVKSRDMIEKIKAEVRSSLNYLVVKALFDAGLVEKEALDAAARQTYGPGAPAQVENIRDAGSEVLGSFGKPPGVM